MKTYKITDLSLTREEPGYNVYDYFAESPDDLRFASRADAEGWLGENYLGEDEDGVGVTWDIVGEEVEITEWCCTDGEGDEDDIEAESAEEAAQKYVGRGDYGDGPTWIDVKCTPLIDGEPVIGEDDQCIAVEIEAEEPECEDGHEHDWCSPYEVLGGLEESPGVHGKGGGVIITEVCSICGTYRVTDTWAQRRDTGEQGLESVEYREADDRSYAWCLMGIRDAISELGEAATAVSEEIHEDAERICGQINDGDHTRTEAAELLAVLRERLEAAVDA